MSGRNPGGGKPIWIQQQELAHAQDAASQASRQVRVSRQTEEHAQARFDNLIDSFAHFTECQMATLEYLKDRKRTPKCEISRQQSITDKMVAVLRKEGFAPRGRDKRHEFPRLAEIFASAEPANKK
jgi:hypothetical protein